MGELWIFLIYFCWLPETLPKQDADKNNFESLESLLCEFCDNSLEDAYYDHVYTTDYVPFTPPDPNTLIPTINPRVPTDFTPQPQCLRETENVNGQTIVWLETNEGEFSVSNPICLDDHLKVVRRGCFDVWENVNCHSVQQPINPCPADLKPTMDNRYCYTLIEETTFPPQCPYPDSIPWAEYVSLNLFPKQPVWMPLERNDTLKYGIDILRYVELSDKFKTPFQICTKSCRIFTYNETFLDKRCLVYHNNTHVEAVSCDDNHAALCVYDMLLHQENSLCAQLYSSEDLKTECKKGGYSPGSDCYCKTTNPIVGESILAEFLSPYQNLLFDKPCRIGLQNVFDQDTPNSFIWTISNTSINYTYWAPEVDYMHPNGIITDEGWIFSNAPPECSIYQIPVDVGTDVEGDLQLNINNYSYELIISNYKMFLFNDYNEPLVYCFTDADAKSIIYQVTELHGEIIDNDYKITFFPIDVDQSGPGNYWCEAFSYPNLKRISSNSQIITYFNAEYVVLLKLKNYEDRLSSYPLTPENLESLQNILRNELPKTISFYPRLFKINGIDEKKKEINITFHITSAEALNTIEEFVTLKQILKSQSIFYFIDFRSVHYCSSSVTKHQGQTVTWPQTIYQGKTSPMNGHCVTDDITFVERRCIGNFIDGAYWSEIQETCYFYPTSSLTDQLINIDSQEKPMEVKPLLWKLLNISEEYDKFNTLDFILIVKFLKGVIGHQPDLNIFAEIISNLMMVPRVILLSSQLNFRSTDILLELVDFTMENSQFDEHFKENFAIKSIDISEQQILGLQLQNCTGYTNCDIVLIDNTVSFNKSYIQAKEINAAVRLSSELYQQIIDFSKLNTNYKPRLVISIYFGSQLFVELRNAKSSSLVFGVLLPGFNETFKGPVSIYYFTNGTSHLSHYNCSYWKFNKEISGSWTIEDTRELNETVVCEFYHITNFRIPIVHKGSDAEMCNQNEQITNQCLLSEQLCVEVNLKNDVLNQFCLLDNLTLIPKSCFSNFTDVASITNLSRNCTVVQLTEVTETIMKLSENLNEDQASDSILQLLVTLTQNYDAINDSALLFVTSFLKATSNGTMDMQKFAGIVNNIMHVPQEVLSKAQQNSKVVDDLLLIIDEMVSNTECSEWKTEKFVIKCLEIDSKNLGIYLENCSGGKGDAYDCDIQIARQTNFTNFQTIDAAVVLSHSLHKQILSYSAANPDFIPKLIVCVYYGTELFVDLKQSRSLAPMAFNVLLPNFNKTFEGPLLILYAKDAELIEYNCTYWKFEENSFGGWVVENSSSVNRAALCEYFHLTNFALPFKPANENNLLLNSDHCLKQATKHHHFYYSLSRTNNVLYDLYGHTELEMYSKKEATISCFKDEENNAASEVDVSSSTTLNDLVEKIDNLFEANRANNDNILFTEGLLYDIDKMLNMFEATLYARGRNIILITISKNDSEYFQGFFINSQQEVNCIFNQEPAQENSDLTITFSNELRKQLKNSKSSIKIAIFLNKLLFSSEHNVTIKLPVIEILLPEIRGYLSGKISIKYANASKGKCAYWNQAINNWEIESDAKIANNIATCTFHHVTHFALVTNTQNITTDLEQILASNLTGLEKLKQVDSITTLNHRDLVAVDIFLISQIITNSLPQGIISGVITRIISTLFMVPREVLRESQEVHSATDIILYTIDEIGRMASNLEEHNQNFSLIVKNVINANITGIMLHNCENYTCVVDYLNGFINVTDYSANKSIAAMVIFSEDLVDQIKNSTVKAKVAISIFYSDALFNEVGNERNTTKIFGIDFPGLTDKLNGTVSVINNIGTTKNSSDNNQCVYWNFKADPTGGMKNVTMGHWVNDSSKQRDRSMAICNYSHVTHFGMLLASNDQYDDDPVLNFITYVGCTLSLIGIAVIWLTAVWFKKWRQNTGNKILVNFSVAISLKIVALYVSVYVKSISYGIYCTITGVILHYATLSECTWMLTVAILQFKRFVEVLGGPPKYVLVKGLVCGWIFPLAPVICVLAIDPNNYEKGLASLCYPSYFGLYFGVWLPVLVILSINSIIFIYIIYNVFHKRTEYIDSSNHDILFQWRLALLLFFMLGLNWAFGFLGQFKGDFLFTYLYSITASLQGFILFLFFIVLNRETRLMYTQSIKHWFYQKGIFKVWKTRPKTNRSL